MKKETKKETKEETIRISRKKKKYVKPRFHVVKVSADAYNLLVDICNDTGHSMRYVADTLITEAAKHVVIEEETTE